jgi:hypothetical protein
MEGRFEDIDIVAVEDPLNGLCLLAHRYGARTASEVETCIPIDSNVQAVAKALIRIYELIHGKQDTAPPPKPARKRPSNEEALAQVPVLMRQFHAALDELGFLFQRHLMPDGYLDQKIGEVIAAYVYDLDLTENHADFSEAKSSDGRTVQVRSTRAHKTTVALEQIGEHLIVVQLCGQEVIEVYNGPLEPVWERAGRVQQDGRRRISMGRLRGQNEYRVPSEQKIQPKRGWKLEQQEDEDHARP